MIVAPRRSIARLLRSRRLALALIAAVVAYCIVGTLVAQGSLTDPKVRAWQVAHPAFAGVARALGMHQAFSAPLFLVLVTLLAISTAACAWERTRTAAAAWRSGGRVTEAEIERLRTRPTIAVPVAHPAAEAMGDVAGALWARRFGVQQGPKLIHATSGRWSVWGSPAFHWLLTLLFVVTAFGRLTRAEGQIAAPLGVPVKDVKSSYGKLAEGPLYPGHSGLTLVGSDLRDFTDAGGVPRGASPVVTLRDGDRVVAAQRVYANNPLRYGRLLIHKAGYGLAANVSIESSRGVETGRAHAALDFAPSSASGTTEGRFDLTAGDAVLGIAYVTIPLDRVGGVARERLPSAPVLEVALASGESAARERTVTLVKGATMPLPGGERMKFLGADYYVRLSVADDVSIYPMYALFVLTGLALCVSLLVPYRRVLVLLTDGADGPSFHALARGRRGDPLFLRTVTDDIRQAAGLPPSAEEESA